MRNAKVATYGSDVCEDGKTSNNWDHLCYGLNGWRLRFFEYVHFLIILSIYMFFYLYRLVDSRALLEDFDSLIALLLLLLLLLLLPDKGQAGHP